jgi:hypothetical protein
MNTAVPNKYRLFARNMQNLNRWKTPMTELKQHQNVYVTQSCGMYMGTKVVGNQEIVNKLSLITQQTAEYAEL